MNMKKPLLIIITAIILIVAVVVFLRFVVGGDEDTWICSNGEWVKHGNPSNAKPVTACTSAIEGQSKPSCETLKSRTACLERNDCLPVDKCNCVTKNEQTDRCGQDPSLNCECASGGFERCETLVCNNNENLSMPTVTYETNTTQSPLYSFDTVKEWTSIAPAEVQKSITQEQRHGYEIVYFASNTDAVTFSVSEKKSSELKNISAIVADDKSVAQTNQSITWIDQRLGATDARTELKTVSGTTEYTVYTRYLIVSASTNETRWALMEVAVPASRTSQYQGVVADLLDSLKLASEASSNGVDLSNQFNWSTMNQGPYRDKITYATSPDLLTWTGSGRILAEHASVPGAVIKDGTIFVYFVDVSEDGVKEQLGMVKSLDMGRTWTEPTSLTISGLGDKATADPAPVLLSDGRIRLFYFDINEARISRPASGVEPANKIYSAISSDGVNFTQEAGVRFERQGAFDPDVELVNGTWHMYTGDVEGNKVIAATSTDGLTFTERGIAYANGAVPDVWYENGQWYLFTAGINIAVSTDGLTFTSNNRRFIDSSYQVTADPSVVKRNDGSYLMLYKVKQ